MIEFRTLGTLDLRRPSSNTRLAPLAQPMRIALLTYLAARPPGRYRTRDEILGLFWPEADEAHARNALNKAVQYLRRELGEEVIVNRGRGQLAADPAVLWCDAGAFHEALARGDHSRALSLYGGELLRGFHVSQAPSFDRWLEEERRRLRSLAAGAAWRLADEAESTGDLDAAAQWARQGLGLSRADERGLRRLLRILIRLGDRARAIAEFEIFARRLAADYDLEPSGETLALIRSIRLQAHTARPVGAGGEGAAVVVVLPFTYRGHDELAYLAGGLVDLLSPRLDRPPVRAIEAPAVMSFVRRAGLGTGLEDGLRVAHQFGADLFVLGSIVEAGGRLEVAATAYDAAGESLSTGVATTTGEEGVFELADELADHLRAATAPAEPLAVSGGFSPPFRPGGSPRLR